VWIILGTSLGRWDADAGQNIDGFLPQGAPTIQEMERHGFEQLLPHPEDGVQRGDRILKDHRDLFASDSHQLRLAKLQEIPAAVEDFPTDAPGRAADQAQDRLGCQRLTRS
jgi:hypothetical protein